MLEPGPVWGLLLLLRLKLAKRLKLLLRSRGAKPKIHESLRGAVRSAEHATIEESAKCKSTLLLTEKLPPCLLTLTLAVLIHFTT